jgi:hypothetical protein
VSEPSTSELVIDGVAAFGALAVAIVAIWGDWVRSVLAPPKLTIRPREPESDPTTDNHGQRLTYYHLKVVNQRPWLPTPNCRVLLNSLSRRGPDGQFHPISFLTNW